MDIGIVSQFGYDNYGNRLQNYALQQKLKCRAESIKTIKLKPIAKNLLFRLKEYSFVADSILINYLFAKRRRWKFVRYNKRYLSCSSRVYCLKREYTSLHKKDNCSLYCVGSDQVWKPTSDFCGPIHYLGFAESDRTFSYAASFGISQIPEEHVEAVRKGLEHIKYISVREDAGKRIVEELTGRTDVYVHVDPTMLLTAEEWDKIAVCPKNGVPEKYILTYFLGEVSEARRRAIQAKAQELGCEIIELMDQNGAYYETGPDEFVYLIKHAEMVCTDSFHGSVFSFLYERPFVVFDRQGAGDNMSSRLETLCGKFFLQDCMSTGDILPEISMTPDYSLGYTVLEEERARSMEYFNMIFEEAERLGLCD